MLLITSYSHSCESCIVGYQIPCSNCDHIYTSESKRTLKVHIQSKYLYVFTHVFVTSQFFTI